MLLNRLGLIENTAYYMSMSGREWDLEDDLSILAPPFDLGKSKLGYEIPSGKHGRSSLEWR